VSTSRALQLLTYARKYSRHPPIGELLLPSSPSLFTAEILRRNYIVSDTTDLLRRNPLNLCLPSYLHCVTERILGLHNHGCSTPEVCLTEVHFRWGHRFDFILFQMPHLTNLYSFLRQLDFFGHSLTLVYLFPDFRAGAGIPAASYCTCRAHN